jgi:hypothetical protein
MCEDLITPTELAKKLKVPKSWIYRQTQGNGTGGIPVVQWGSICDFG